MSSRSCISHSQHDSEATDTSSTSSMTSNTSMSTPPSCVSFDGDRMVPTEVFVAAAAYLDKREISIASRVCRSWRLALHADQRLWHALTLFIDTPYALHRLVAWLQRAGRSLDVLVFLHQGPSPWDIPFIEQRFSQVRKILKSHGYGGPSIEYIRFRSSDDTPHSLCAMHAFFAHFLNPADPHFLPKLSEVVVDTGVTLPVISRHFLDYTNDMTDFTLRGTFVRDKLGRTRQMSEHMALWLSGPGNAIADAEVEPENTADTEQEIEELPSSQLSNLHLEKIAIEHDFRVPDFPLLTLLVLAQVNIGRAFYKILENAPNLEEIHLFGIVINDYDLQHAHLEEFDAIATYIKNRRDDIEDPADLDDAEFNALSDNEMLTSMRWSEYRWRQQWDKRNINDEPIIYLTKVKRIITVGPYATAWWQIDAQKHPAVPEVQMPNLRQADLKNVKTLDDIARPHELHSARRTQAVEAAIDDAEWGNDDEDTIATSLSALWSLCSGSPTLTHLNLVGSEITDASFAESVRCLDILEVLVLRGCTDLSDTAMQSLGEHCPYLRHLDIRETFFNARMVATLYEMVRKAGGHLAVIFMEDPGPYVHSESELFDNTAYGWLQWIGVIAEPAITRGRKDGKGIWKDSQYIEAKRQRRMRPVQQ